MYSNHCASNTEIFIVVHEILTKIKHVLIGGIHEVADILIPGKGHFG